MIDVPPGVVRNFTNVSDDIAHLLVFIQGDRDKFQDVDMRPKDGEMIADKFGEDVLDNLKAAGLKFTVGLDG